MTQRVLATLHFDDGTMLTGRTFLEHRKPTDQDHGDWWGIFDPDEARPTIHTEGRLLLSDGRSGHILFRQRWVNTLVRFDFRGAGELK